MRIGWHTTGDICGRVYSELENTAPNRFDGLVNILSVVSVAFVVINGFLTVITLKPSMTMGMLGSVVLGSNSANVSLAKQKEVNYEKL